MTQVARGLDPDGLLLVDMKIDGKIPESLADADLHVQVRALGCSPLSFLKAQKPVEMGLGKRARTSQAWCRPDCQLLGRRDKGGFSTQHPSALLASLIPALPPRTSRSTTCRQGLASYSWAPHSASSMTASQAPCAAITASSMTRPGASSPSWCSIFGPPLSAQPLTLRQRP